MRKHKFCRKRNGRTRALGLLLAALLLSQSAIPADIRAENLPDSSTESATEWETDLEGGGASEVKTDSSPNDASGNPKSSSPDYTTLSDSENQSDLADSSGSGSSSPDHTALSDSENQSDLADSSGSESRQPDSSGISDIENAGGGAEAEDIAAGPGEIPPADTDSASGELSTEDPDFTSGELSSVEDVTLNGEPSPADKATASEELSTEDPDSASDELSPAEAAALNGESPSEDDTQAEDIVGVVTAIENSDYLSAIPTVTIMQNERNNRDPLIKLAVSLRSVTARAEIGGMEETLTLSVKWTIGNYYMPQIDVSTPGLYEEVGTILLPEGYVFGENVLQQIVIPVEVTAFQNVEITSIKSWGAFENAFAVLQGSDPSSFPSDKNLPDYWQCYDAEENTYFAPIFWDVSQVNTETAGIYQIKGILSPPENTVFSQDLGDPFLPIYLSVQAAGKPELNCVTVGYAGIYFPWVAPSGDPDAVRVWLCEEGGSWVDISEQRMGRWTDTEIILYVSMLEWGKSYQLKAEYEGGCTNVFSFRLDESFLINNGVDGRRDGDDTDGNDSGTLLQPAPDPDDAGGSGDNSGSASGGGNSGSGSSSGENNSDGSGSSSGENSSDGSDSSSGENSSDGSDSASGEGNSGKYNSDGSGSSSGKYNSDGSDSASGEGNSGNSGSGSSSGENDPGSNNSSGKNSASGEDTGKAESSGAAGDSPIMEYFGEDYDSISGARLLLSLEAFGAAQFSKHGITLTVPASAFKELEIDPQDRFQITILKGEKQTFTIHLARNGQTIEELSGATVTVPWAFSKDQPLLLLLDETRAIVSLGDCGSSAQAAAFSIERPGSYTVIEDSGAVSALLKWWNEKEEIYAKTNDETSAGLSSDNRIGLWLLYLALFLQ